MMTRPRPWTQHLRRALAAPGNLLVGAGAVVASAITWNPLPLILYGLGEPLWLYKATASQRYSRELRAERRDAAREDNRKALGWHEQQLAYLLQATPCGLWTKRGLLPDYATTYGRLVEMREQTAHIVATRDDPAAVLEQDIVARMDDMLRAYLLMARERLLFHCSLARVYPQLPEPPTQEQPTLLDRMKRALVAAPPEEPIRIAPWRDDTRFVTLDDAQSEVRSKIAGFERDASEVKDHEEVYQPILEVLTRRLDELEQRGKNDRVMAAQLKVFPDQFELILNKLATTRADVSEVVGDMKLLLEQTDDTVSFAEEIRSSERHTLGKLTSLGHA